MKKMKYTIAAAMCGLGLVAGLAAAPASAFALNAEHGDMTMNTVTTGQPVNGTGTTEVTIQGLDYTSPVDPNQPGNPPADAYQLKVKVPTKVPLIMKADGTIFAPTNAKISNESAIPVDVTAVKVEGKSAQLTLKAKDAIPAPGQDDIVLEFGPTGQAIDAAKFANATDPQWNYIAGTGEMPLTFTGYIASLSNPLSTTAGELATITFTISAATAQP